jgi:hypothetical protein
VITEQDVPKLPGRSLVGNNDEVLGVIDSVYRDVDNDEPLFAAVVFQDQGQRLVPLLHAELQDEAVTVPYALELVSAAPAFADHDDLTPLEEQTVFAHYGLAVPEQ